MKFIKGFYLIIVFIFASTFIGCPTGSTGSSDEISFPITGIWELTLYYDDDPQIWTADLVITDINGNDINGFFDWFSPDGDGDWTEYFTGFFDRNNRKILLAGFMLDPVGLHIPSHNYEAILANNNRDFVNGVWTEVWGQALDKGTWNAVFQQ